MFVGLSLFSVVIRGVLSMNELIFGKFKILKVILIGKFWVISLKFLVGFLV